MLLTKIGYLFRIINWYLLIYSLFCLVLFFFITSVIYINNYSNYYYTVEKELDTPKYRELNTLEVCLYLRCKGYLDLTNYKEYIYTPFSNELVYIPNGAISNTKTIYRNITEDYNIIVKHDNKIFVIGNKIYNELLTPLFSVYTLIVIAILVILSMLASIKLIKHSYVKKGKMKHELTPLVQREIAEMVNHELATPIAVLESEVNNVLSNRYGLYMDEITTEKYTDMRKKATTEEEIEEVDAIMNIKCSIERIKAILKFISSTKKIKNGNGTINIGTIINNVVNSVNTFSVNKMTYNIVDPDGLLNMYSVHHKYGNGNFLNALQVLFNNSMEAHATELTISCYLYSKNGKFGEMCIELSDNGSGIIGYKNLESLNKSIFSYGFSTKSDIKFSITDRILHRLGIIDYNTGRGIGLYITRKILEDSGGSLKVIGTSIAGTTFELRIPVKLTVGL